MSLRQLGAAGTHDQRHVRVDRLIVVTQSAPEREDAVRRVDEILAPQHVRDLHLEVVDGVREEEHRRSVRSDDHEVGDRRPLDRNLAANRVGEGAATVVGRTEPDRRSSTLGCERGPILRRQVATTPVVTRGTAFAHRLLVAFTDLGLGAVALVRAAVLDHAPSRGEVRVEPRALKIGTFVPVESQPAEHLLDLVDRLLRRPRDVGVLDPEDERAPHMACVQPVVQSRTHATDVQESGRRGRETEAGLAHRISESTRQSVVITRRGAAWRSRRVGSGSFLRRSA